MKKLLISAALVLTSTLAIPVTAYAFPDLRCIIGSASCKVTVPPVKF